MSNEVLISFIENCRKVKLGEFDALGGSGPIDLGRYMDEVNQEIDTFDVWIYSIEKDVSKGGNLSTGFFGEWGTFLYTSPPSKDSRGRPFGWRTFYAEYRGWLLPDYLDNWVFGTGEELWDQTEAFENNLIRFYDWAVEAKANPPMKRPEHKYQPPPPEKTIEGKAWQAAQWVGIIGAVAAAGYLIHSIRKE